MGIGYNVVVMAGLIRLDKIASGNRTPGSRSYSDLLDTLADSVCIHLLVLKRCSSTRLIVEIVGS